MAAYVDRDFYRARTATEQNDAELDAQLEAASRMVDAELYHAPGHFAPIANTVYAFAPTVISNVLKLVDESGLAYALRAVNADGITATWASGGTFTADLTADWIDGRPLNAVVLGNPYTALALKKTDDAEAKYWPRGGTVQIAGAWGYAEVPPPIKELTVHVCRDFRDSFSGGAAAAVQAFEEGVAYRDDTWRLWRMVKRRWGNMPDGLRKR